METMNSMGILELLSEDVIQYLSFFMDVPSLMRFIETSAYVQQLLDTQSVWRERAQHLPLTKRDPFISQVEENNYWKQYYFCMTGVRYSERYKSKHVDVSEDGLEAVCSQQNPFFIVKLCGLVPKSGRLIIRFQAKRDTGDDAYVPGYTAIAVVNTQMYKGATVTWWNEAMSKIIPADSKPPTKGVILMELADNGYHSTLDRGSTRTPWPHQRCAVELDLNRTISERDRIDSDPVIHDGKGRLTFTDPASDNELCVFNSFYNGSDDFSIICTLGMRTTLTIESASYHLEPR